MGWTFATLVAVSFIAGLVIRSIAARRAAARHSCSLFEAWVQRWATEPLLGRRAGRLVLEVAAVVSLIWVAGWFVWLL